MENKPINGAKPDPVQKPVKLDPRKAVAIMSEGFLTAMRFLQQHGMPQDLMMEAMRIGQQHGLCTRKDGFGVNGVPTMQYINPYADLVNPAPKIITDTEGQA